MSDTVVDRAVSAAPGTSREIAAKLGVSVATANRWIRAARDAGRLDCRVRWITSLAYTRVYFVKPAKPQEKSA